MMKSLTLIQNPLSGRYEIAKESPKECSQRLYRAYENADVEYRIDGRYRRAFFQGVTWWRDIGKFVGVYVMTCYDRFGSAYQETFIWLCTTRNFSEVRQFGQRSGIRTHSFGSCRY